MRRHLIRIRKGDVRYVPTIDERSRTIKAVKLDDVKRFHEDSMAPSNGELAIVGDFDADAVKKLVAELFGDWKSPQAVRPMRAKPYREISPVNQSLTDSGQGECGVHRGHAAATDGSGQ